MGCVDRHPDGAVRGHALVLYNRLYGRDDGTGQARPDGLCRRTAPDTGRLAVQCVMTLKPGKNGDKLINAWDYDEKSTLAVVSHYNGHLNTGYDYGGCDFVNAEMFYVLLLGVVLLLMCGFGIAGSI